MYGKRGRIGCIIPSTNTVVESELNRLKPQGVSVHADRIPAENVTPEELRRLAEEAPESAARLATARVDVIVFCCTSGSFLEGGAWEANLAQSMEAVSSVPCLTTSGAVVEALKQFGVRQFVMATPYTDRINERERRFFEEKGFRIVSMKGLQKTVNTEIGNLEPDQAYQIARQVIHDDAEAIFISCTDFRTVEIIERLEAEVGLPVITSNQASFWLALRALDIQDPIAGCGRLLSIPKRIGVKA